VKQLDQSERVKELDQRYRSFAMKPTGKGVFVFVYQISFLFRSQIREREVQEGSGKVASFRLSLEKQLMNLISFTV